jgi:hypothetical protein
MAVPTHPLTRSDFKTYCLRRLGQGVVDINISDDQAEDRINDALAFYRDYHFDGTARVWLQHEVTGSTFVVDTNTESYFDSHDVLHGETSNAYAQTYSLSSNTITMLVSNGTFVAGEVVRGSVSNAVANIVSVTLGDIDNHYVEVPETILNVTRIVAPFGNQWQSSSEILFNLNYHLRSADLWNLQSTSMLPYYIAKRHLSLIDELLNGIIGVQFSRHQNRITIDWNWESTVSIGSKLIFEAYRVLDPNDVPKIWADRFLRDYATELMRYQWGSNLSKLGGIQLPGGVTLNGERIMDEAKRNIEKLEKDAEERYQFPPTPLLG